MRLIAMVLAFSLVTGCAAKEPPAALVAGPGQVVVTAEVVQFHPGGLHEDYSDGGWAVFDITVLRVICPGEWRDRTFEVLGGRKPAAPEAFHTVGTRWTFLMNEDRIRAMVADPTTGGTSYQVFETGLEKLTRVQQGESK
jgi:hypothetical protein